MLIVPVSIHIKPEFVDLFKKFTVENAQNSLLEPGIARFDLLQSQGDPTRFLLVEVYRDEQAPAKHRRDRPLPALAGRRGGDDGGTA